MTARTASWLCSVLLLFSACGGERPVLFPVYGTLSLSALSREAAKGVLDYSKPKRLEYQTSPFSARVPMSLEIEYEFNFPPADETVKKFRLALEIGARTWELPANLSFLGIEGDKVIHYAVPVEDQFAGRFSILLTPLGEETKDKTGLMFKINSVELVERWFGFYPQEQEGEHFFISPFVYKKDDAVVADVPSIFGTGQNGYAMLAANFSPGRNVAVSLEGKRYVSGTGRITLPGVSGQGQAAVSGGINSLIISYPAPEAFPSPIEADPGLILEWPQENWRSGGYEVFRWEGFPSLLIFDTSDYRVQDRLLKRLAFFVEKAGFTGRLAADAEIANLHGWNAHDYRAADLARFFDAARRANFPLLEEERRLEMILRNEGIIVETSGGIAAGQGGIISISRESADYLRYLFMAHEGFHGLFFIDGEFRDFSRRRWENLDSRAKRFIASYFGYQQYNIRDEYLLVNEFMAHILQQPVSQAGRYFGQTLPSRLEPTWRIIDLPEKDEAGFWPDLAASFTREAEAFSAYVNRRWGLAAGRVWQIDVR